MGRRLGEESLCYRCLSPKYRHRPRELYDIAQGGVAVDIRRPRVARHSHGQVGRQVHAEEDQIEPVRPMEPPESPKANRHHLPGRGGIVSTQRSIACSVKVRNTRVWQTKVGMHLCQDAGRGDGHHHSQQQQPTHHTLTVISPKNAKSTAPLSRRSKSSHW